LEKKFVDENQDLVKNKAFRTPSEGFAIKLNPNRTKQS